VANDARSYCGESFVLTSDPSGPPNEPLICVMGPTAAGKSSVAMALVERFPMEIVSVDSALVYRGMDIGTAKPQRSEQQNVRHHLIDLIDPAQTYSAARFCQDANRAIDDIRARKRVPLLVGGTMLYFKALREGLDALPPADPQLRARLHEEGVTLGWTALHDRLRGIDPAMAARVSPHDTQRIGRALEVWYQTGRAMSTFWVARPTLGNRHFVHIALEPSARADLHARIEMRFDRMLESGFIDEVRALRARGDLHMGLPSMRCVGYRQVWQYLDGQVDTQAMRNQAIAATRQLAKRQLTWLRALPDRHVVDAYAHDAHARATEIVATELARRLD